MSNDRTYQRMLNLWISVWKLVQDRNRVRELVTAALQKIVHQEKGLPQFKNWRAIQTGWATFFNRDEVLMMKVATVDLKNPGERERSLVATFPQCFSYKKIRESIPLSTIQNQGARDALIEGGDANKGAQLPMPYLVHETLGIPVLTLTVSDEAFWDADGTCPRFVPRLSASVISQGSRIVFDNMHLVVIEHNDAGMISCAPAELVTLD